jgi:hypothetical protein
MKKAEVIAKLSSAKPRWFIMSSTGPIVASKMIGGKVIKISLNGDEHGKYFLSHPSYKFNSTISHYSATQTNTRLSLNKSVVKRVVEDLKKVGVWPYITNKVFVTVNDLNKKSKKAVIKAELDSLLS